METIIDKTQAKRRRSSKLRYAHWQKVRSSESEIEFLETLIKKKEGEINTLKLKDKEEIKIINEQRGERKKLLKQIEGQQKDLATKDSMIQNLTKRISQVCEERRSSVCVLTATQEQNDGLMKEIDGYKEEINNLRKRISEDDEALKAFQARLSVSEVNRSKKTNDIDRLWKEMDGYKENIKYLEEVNIAKANEIIEKNQMIHSKDAIIDELTKKVGIISDKLQRTVAEDSIYLKGTRIAKAHQIVEQREMIHSQHEIIQEMTKKFDKKSGKDEAIIRRLKKVISNRNHKLFELHKINQSLQQKHSDSVFVKVENANLLAVINVYIDEKNKRKSKLNGKDALIRRLQKDVGELRRNMYEIQRIEQMMFDQQSKMNGLMSENQELKNKLKRETIEELQKVIANRVEKCHELQMANTDLREQMGEAHDRHRVHQIQFYRLEQKIIQLKDKVMRKHGGYFEKIRHLKEIIFEKDWSLGVKMCEIDDLSMKKNELLHRLKALNDLKMAEEHENDTILAANSKTINALHNVNTCLSKQIDAQIDEARNENAADTQNVQSKYEMNEDADDDCYEESVEMNGLNARLSGQMVVWRDKLNRIEDEIHKKIGEEEALRKRLFDLGLRYNALQKRSAFERTNGMKWCGLLAFASIAIVFGILFIFANYIDIWAPITNDEKVLIIRDQLMYQIKMKDDKISKLNRKLDRQRSELPFFDKLSDSLSLDWTLLFGLCGLTFFVWSIKERDTKKNKKKSVKWQRWLENENENEIKQKLIPWEKMLM